MTRDKTRIYSMGGGGERVEERGAKQRRGKGKGKGKGEGEGEGGRGREGRESILHDAPGA